MTILVTGATGQIGSELVPFLRQKYGNDRVVITIKPGSTIAADLSRADRAVLLDATDRAALENVVEKYKIDTIYHLVGILSARGEQQPDLAWNTNMVSLKNILDIAVGQKVKKVFWPSSIAAFGSTTPRKKTSQRTIMEPSTMYGVTKVAGELLCQYYHNKFGLDVRSVRFPGIISYKTEPGGGTTDYAVDMFYQALLNKKYTCFVNADTMLPMMYMDDAIRAIDLLMEAPSDRLSVRTSYNLTALHFTAAELAIEIQKHIHDFKCDYNPDYRQQIADSWPQSIDDSVARRDWDWQPSYDLPRMTNEMIIRLREKLANPPNSKSNSNKLNMLPG